MYKRLLAGVLAVIMLMGFVTVSATSINEMQNEQQQLEQEEKQVQAELEKKKQEIEKQEAEVQAVATKVSNVNAQVIESLGIIASYDEQIAKKTEEVDALNKENEENMKVLRSRIRALYMAGDASSLEIILGASDFSDFVDKIQLVESISDYDAKLIDNIEAQLDTINAEMEKINKAKADQQKEQKKLEKKQDEYNKLLAQHKDKLANLYTQKDEAEDLLHSNQNAQSELEKQIQKYYAQQQQQNRPSSGSSSSGSPSNSGAAIVAPSGGYVWPVPGIYTLSSAYYDERGNYNHGGIDIAGGGYMGAMVVAAASGTVIVSNNSCTHNWGKNGSCGCGGGFGNYVWIDHGNGKATIYAHLTNTVVGVGSYVSAGQVLGYGGSTGWSTGPHLHFECRYYGAKYDPMSEY